MFILFSKLPSAVSMYWNYHQYVLELLSICSGITISMYWNY